MGSVTKIPDYSIFNVPPYLIERLQNSGLDGILEAKNTQYEELETVFYSLFTEIWLSVAIGKQLDILGIHLGLPRNGRSDTEYRAALIVKAGINSGSGTPEEIIQNLIALYGFSSVKYKPLYPGKFGISQEDKTAAELAENERFIPQVLPAGVSLVWNPYRITRNSGRRRITRNGTLRIAIRYFGE